MDLFNYLASNLGVSPILLIFIFLIIYFLPTILANYYGVFQFGFLIMNLFFGRTPAPRAILIIKAIKNKNLYYHEERGLELTLSKKEQQEINSMIQEKEKRLASIKSPIEINNQK